MGAALARRPARSSHRPRPTAGPRARRAQPGTGPDRPRHRLRPHRPRRPPRRILARPTLSTTRRPPDPAHHRAAARKRIIREVEDAIQRRQPDGDTDEACLHAELHDRLDSPDLDRRHRQPPHTRHHRRNLPRPRPRRPLPGTDPWKRRTPADIRMLCTRAAPPPTAAGTAAHPPPSTLDPPPGPTPSGPAKADPTTAPIPDPGPPNGAAPAANILHYPPAPRDRWRPPPRP